MEENIRKLLEDQIKEMMEDKLYEEISSVAKTLYILKELDIAQENMCANIKNNNKEDFQENVKWLKTWVSEL